MQLVKINEVKANPNNPRVIKDDKYAKLLKSIQEFPQMLELRPIVVNDDMVVLGGNMRLKACKEAGLKEIPIIKASTLTDEQQKEFIIKDNVGYGEWDWDTLANEWDAEQLTEWGLDIPGFETPNIPTAEEATKKLEERFIVPPFSVLDTRQGYWQDRKRHWLAMRIESEIGRGDGLTFNTTEWVNEKGKSGLSGNGSDTSIFDPVLCELAYRWFCPERGTIVDPFAGGSVRGIVAAKIGYQYIGVDLRKEQIDANREQANRITPDNPPVWHCGNSLNIDSICKGVEADLVFSCPPYFDLEVYSDDPQDLSAMDYDTFKQQYREIIHKSVALLKPNRFAVFVIGDVRDKKGFYRNLVSETIDCFQTAGAILYNEMILVNVAGSLPIRAAKQFNSGRKTGKMHQNVLCFFKGDPKTIKNTYGELDLSEITTEDE